MKKAPLLSLLILTLLSSCTFVSGPNTCDTWRTKRVDGKVGYETRGGKEMIPPQFEHASRFNDNCFAEVEKFNVDGSDLTALIDSTGKVRTEWCDYFRELDNHTYIATKTVGEDRVNRLLGTDLEPLSEWYDDIRSFKKGMLKVYKDEEAALMTAEGKLLTAFDYTGFEMLENELMIGEYWKDGEHRQALLDPTGQILSEWYDDIGELKEGRLKVRVDGERSHTYGYIDEKGELVIPAKYTSAHDFSDGLAKVGKGEFGQEIGYIDAEGEVVIPLIWSRVLHTYENMFLLEKRSGKHFVGKDNRQLAGPFHRIHCSSSGGGISIGKGNGPFGLGIGRGSSCKEGFFHGGLIAVGKKQGGGYKWGFLNEKAEEALPFKYDYAWNFSQGMAAVEVKGKFGYINPQGDWVIEPQFDHARPFEKGVANVKLNGEKVKIDSTGKVVADAW